MVLGVFYTFFSSPVTFLKAGVVMTAARPSQLVPAVAQ